MTSLRDVSARILSIIPANGFQVDGKIRPSLFQVCNRGTIKNARLLNVARSEEAHPVPPKEIAVANTMRLVFLIRHTCLNIEEELAAELKERGLNAVPGYRFFPEDGTAAVSRLKEIAQRARTIRTIDPENVDEAITGECRRSVA